MKYTGGEFQQLPRPETIMAVLAQWAPGIR